MIKSKNGTFFSKTKKVFKSKPARIIFALLIIGGIMTAVSFAVIFLMKKLKQKCTDKPGMTWNDDLQMCVQQGCTNICNGKVDSTKAGNCMPDSYCSGLENPHNIPYIFDPDSCGCTLSGCPSDQVPYSDKNGNNYVLPNEDGTIDYLDQLYCGTYCKAQEKISIVLQISQHVDICCMTITTHHLIKDVLIQVVMSMIIVVLIPYMRVEVILFVIIKDVVLIVKDYQDV